MALTMQYDEIDVDEEMEKFPLEAVLGRVYVKEFEVEKAGTLFIPESAKDGTMQTNTGVVLAVGPEVDIVQPRQIVYYGRHSGAYIKFDGMKYRVMNEEDLLGIVKDGGGNNE